MILPFASCLTLRFLPATISTVPAGLISSSPPDPDTLVPSLATADVFRVKPLLLIAFAISLAVANLPASASVGALTLPLPVFVSGVVFAVIWVLPSAVFVVMVVPSTFTLYFTVVVLPLSVFVTSTLVAVPSANTTLSPGFTRSF